MIVLDSSFLIAYHNKNDAHHSSSLHVMQRFLEGEFGKGLLLEYVFLEVVTVLLLRCGLDIASDVAKQLLSAQELQFVSCSSLFLDVLEVFRAQENRKLSFADCAIVVVARRQDRGLVATFDQGLGTFDLPGIVSVKTTPL